MTDRDIKKMLSKAYASKETNKENKFIHKYEKRSRRIWDVFKIEIRYMGIQSVLVGMLLCLLFVLVAHMDDINLMWTVSSLIPIGAAVPLFLLSRSERYGMDELEAASRFSLRFVRFVRLFIIGIVTLILFVATGVILKSISVATNIDYMIIVVIPYLITDFGAMLITRKWHSKGNVLGIAAVCMLGCIIPFIIKEIRMTNHLPDITYGIITVILLVAVCRECILYVKESENLSWNLC